MPLADYFQRDIGSNWCQTPDTTTVYKVNNSAPAFVAIFFMNFALAISMSMATQNYGLFGMMGSAFPFLLIALQSIKGIRRDGESITITQVGGGTMSFPLSDIESVKVGYKYSCCDCKQCGIFGETGKDEASNLLLVFKKKIGGCCGYRNLIVSVADGKIDEFISTLVNTNEKA